MIKPIRVGPCRPTKQAMKLLYSQPEIEDKGNRTINQGLWEGEHGIAAEF